MSEQSPSGNPAPGPGSGSERTIRLVVDPQHPTAQVTLLDATYRLIAQGVGALVADVRPGLYELQYKVGRSVVCEPIRVMTTEPMFSVTPVEPLTTRTTAVPERSSDTAAWAHLESRQPSKVVGHGGELFVLARLLQEDADEPTRNVFERLTIHSLDGQVVVDFGADAKRGPRHASSCVNVALDPGTYIVQTVAGSYGTLEQAVHVAHGWQTQLLMTPTEYGPHEASTRSVGADVRRAAVLMSRIGIGFNAADPAVGWVEAAKVALAGGTPAAPVGELKDAVRRVAEGGAPLDQLLNDKFTNPMLGILGCHLLLLERPRDMDLVREVTTNLEMLVPGHPDVAALRLLLDPHGGGVCEAPPMLRSSWQLIVNGSLINPDIVPEGSYASSIATRTWGGGAWLVWRRPADSEAAGVPAAASPAAVVPARSTVSVAANLITSLADIYQTLESALPRQGQDQYAGVVASTLNLDRVQSSVLRYAVGAVTKKQCTENLSAVRKAQAVTTQRYADVRDQLLERDQPDVDAVWTAPADDRDEMFNHVISVLGIPQNTLAAASRSLSDLLKRTPMAHPRICFDRILPKDLDKVRPTSPIANAKTRAAWDFAKLWRVGQTLRIRFMGGTPEQHAIVTTFAPQWCQHANIRFEFSNDLNAEIRIAFVASDGAWSYVGTDCASIPISKPTMNLGWQDEGVVLHEFGHALGLIHEHQNPVHGITWNRPAVIKDLSGPPNYWDEQTIEHNMFTVYSHDQVNATELDKDSIMLYAIPGHWTLDGWSSRENHVLSARDQEYAHAPENYPFNGPRVPK